MYINPSLSTVDNLIQVLNPTEWGSYNEEEKQQLMADLRKHKPLVFRSKDGVIGHYTRKDPTIKQRCTDILNHGSYLFNKRILFQHKGKLYMEYLYTLDINQENKSTIEDLSLLAERHLYGDNIWSELKGLSGLVDPEENLTFELKEVHHYHNGALNVDYYYVLKAKESSLLYKGFILLHSATDQTYKTKIENNYKMTSKRIDLRTVNDQTSYHLNYHTQNGVKTTYVYKDEEKALPVSIITNYTVQENFISG